MGLSAIAGFLASFGWSPGSVCFTGQVSCGPLFGPLGPLRVVLEKGSGSRLEGLIRPIDGVTPTQLVLQNLKFSYLSFRL